MPALFGNAAAAFLLPQFLVAGARRIQKEFGHLEGIDIPDDTMPDSWRGRSQRHGFWGRHFDEALS